MPIYEEKLICPLAVRFSQDHIRPEFINGSDIEAAIKAIKTKPGSDDFDIVLVPPFPAIEVIRGHLKSGDANHWLSLDNRRLYCLQRAAAAHWPKRAGVVVEALRAPTEGMRKKVNSSVDGLSVGIGHSPKALTGRWDWQQEVKHKVDPEGMDRIVALMTLDDAKAHIQDLSDAEAQEDRFSSMLDRFFQNEKAGDPSDSSTVEPRSPRGSEGSNDSSMMNTSQEQGDWKPDIVGAWEDDKGNSYSITIATATSWTCWRKNTAGNGRKFTLWYDEATDSLSWGDDWSCWSDASDIRSDISSVSWYAGKDAAKKKPRFTWNRAHSQPVVSKPSRQPKRGKKATAL